MFKKSIIIIGGGIAGLAAGCYGRMNGFRTRIFEIHKMKPGGLCTAWRARATRRTAAFTGSWDLMRDRNSIRRNLPRKSPEPRPSTHVRCA